jgi:hypothetical protein
MLVELSVMEQRYQAVLLGRIYRSSWAAVLRG